RRGVKVLRLADGRHVARFIDPVTGKQQQQSLDKLGLTNAKARDRWAIEKATALKSLAAQVAVDGTVQNRATVEQAQADYLKGFGNANTSSAKLAPFASIAAHIAERGTTDMQDVTAPMLAAWADHVRRPANPHRVSTRNLYLVVASAWLRWCRRRGLLP